MLTLDIGQLQLTPQDLALLRQLLVQHVPNADVWAYGSRVVGGAHAGSDVDLVLRNPLDLRAEVVGWMDLREALQDSLLPVMVDVHDWAHLPPAFQEEIERHYVVVNKGIN